MIYFEEGPETKNKGGRKSPLQVTVYMVRGGLKYPLNGQPGAEAAGSAKEARSETERMKAQLISNGCRYATLYGQFENPFELLADMQNSGDAPDRLFFDRKPAKREFGAYTDFHGTRQKTPGAFMYRIFDELLAAQIKEQVQDMQAGFHEGTPRHGGAVPNDI